MAWYTLTKAWGAHAAGEQIELDPEMAAPLLGTFCEPVPEAKSPETEMLTKAVGSISEKLFEAVGKTVDASVAAVTERLKASTGQISLVAAQEDKTKSFGDFFMSVINNDREKLATVYKSPLNSQGGPSGGYLIPPEFLAQIMQVSAEQAIVRPRAMVVPIQARSIQIPALDQSTIPVAGQTAFFGGLQAYWVEEAQTRPEVEPSFKQIELTARELSGYSTASRTLLADNAVSLNTVLTRMFSRAIAWHEDYAFLHGNGVGKPRGVSTSAATIQVTRNASSHFKLADAAAMWAKLLPASMNNAVWIMSQTLIPELIQMADSSGRVVFIPNMPGSPAGGATMAMPMSLLGRPILFTEKQPPLGNAGDVMLVDLSYYLVGDRAAIEVATSDQYRFATNQIVWRFIHRVDGQPWVDAPFTYSDGTTQVSPFVMLI